MFFTQNDYKKIQEWLQRNSVKDTEFQEADIPLNGNEIITLTQNSHTRKVYLKDLVEQMFSIGVTDFVNVSSLHDKYNITLNEAIQLAPHKSRKKGQVITFCNTDNVWKIYQFTGVKNQWNILDLWNDLFDWTTILDVNFGPDEEDITANKSDDNIKLSFKDRVYEPASHSGLGYKILRKNIVTYNDPTQGELTKNILVQDKVAQSNTIYEIRYDFDLNNQTINIPENSVLQYKGGSLNNGKIVYNNTIIEGIERLNNVTTEGDYTYPYTGDETNPDEQLAPTLAQVRKLSTEVTNIADDEDLTKTLDSEKGQYVLQLKDRQYVQGSNSGMGYVILRQNKSFKEQLTQSNTIYEIRYDFDLGGEEVEIPENCVLKFEGGRLSNVKLKGDNLRFDYYDTNIGGNKSIPDIFDMLSDCYAFNYRGTTFTNIVNIYLDYGYYVIDRPIRFKNYGKSFSLIGKGSKKTIVDVTIEDSNLEDNKAAFLNKKETINETTYHGFGFSIFKDITFRGGNSEAASRQVFMDVDTSNSYAVPQNIKFIDCSFSYFKRIIKSTGNVMGSEFFFSRTEIKEGASDSILFYIDNHESVNFMFNQCCIESNKGILFYVNKGSYINVNQSSVIMDGDKASLVYAGVSSTPTNQMGTTFRDCRFELKNGAKLVNIESSSKMHILFDGCRMGVNKANTTVAILGENTLLTIYNCDSIGENSKIILSENAATKTAFQGIINTDNESVFNAVMSSESFLSMSPALIGVCYKLIYKGKTFKLPYDYPSAKILTSGRQAFDNSEIKVESVSFAYYRGALTVLYPYPTEDERVVSREINRFVSHLEIFLQKSPQISGYPYRLEFEIFNGAEKIKSATLENKGTTEKIYRINVGAEVTSIKVTRYNDTITTGGERSLLGYMNLYYR